jgi:hypothetical protein
MTAAQERERCETCRFYGSYTSRTGYVSNSHSWGRSGWTCRRRSPAETDMGEASWPIVEPTEWCGEYRPADGVGGEG